MGSDELTKRLKMWLNNPQCGGKNYQFFGEITIKASPPIYLKANTLIGDWTNVDEVPFSPIPWPEPQWDYAFEPPVLLTCK